MRQLIGLFIVLIVTQLTLGCGSTTLMMKDGTNIRGRVVSSDAAQIQFKSKETGDLLTVERGKVEDIAYAGSTVEAWGIGLTVTGGAAVILGLAIGLNNNDDWGQAAIAGLLTVCGAPLVLGGVPLWISGAVDKSGQRQLYEFDAKTGMFNTPTQPGTYKLTLRF